MRTCVIFLLLVLFAIPAEALTYRWVDKEGNTNYTDDLGNVPQQYRKGARIVGQEEDAAPPPSAENKEKANKGDKAKWSGESGEQSAPATRAQKKSYGGKTAETWKKDFGQLDADIKAAEDQLSELNDRMKDTSKMSRGEYVSIQMGINSAESRLQRLRGKRDALVEEANRADVPAELRGQ